ncbi:MAG: glycosyltransferase family 9 protein [Deltaproteobacteria bacterium]|nr:glycosyltransferase family 9 protein [Deltaproteobacteria bacterium]
MNIEFQRKVDRFFGTIICRVFSIFGRKKKAFFSETRPNKILVILLSEMGSLALAHPMFCHIKKKYPGSSISVLLFQQNKEFLDVLGVISSENVITVSNTSILKMVLTSIRAVFKIRRQKIDAVIDCELFSRISSIFSFMSGAAIMAGFHPHTQEGLYRGDFINRPVLYNPYVHISQQFLTMAEAIESDFIPTVKRKVPEDGLELPLLELEEKKVADTQRKFEADFPGTTGKKLILIYPGGGLLPIRAWPIDNFCDTAKDFLKNGYAVGIIGMEGDRALAGVISSRCENESCVDLTGYTKTVRELMVIFHFVSLLITNDGGPGHFAAMTPMPAITLYGPETPLLYGPLSKKSYNFYAGLSCSPCLTAYNHRNSPCDGDNLCLKYIRPEDVLMKAYEMLKA